ncbi:hypothetical protein EAH57_12420 [Acinetobacter sp. 2JN-4]|nr:hypothetical protein EAH57_12420 [Acinetobacter sp. 2JN-4]
MLSIASHPFCVFFHQEKHKGFMQKVYYIFFLLLIIKLIKGKKHLEALFFNLLNCCDKYSAIFTCFITTNGT